MTDEKLFEAVKIFEDLKIEYCLVTSTLLSIIRDGGVWKHDREVDTLIDCHDLAKIKDHPLTNRILDAVEGFPNINMREDTVVVMGAILKGNYAVLNWTNDCFIIYDKDVIYPFKKMEYKGKTISIPNKPARFLEEYYGKWKVDQPTWKWINAHNLIHADSIDEAIKIKEKKC
jgi:hypothetical protein